MQAEIVVVEGGELRAKVGDELYKLDELVGLSGRCRELCEYLQREQREPVRRIDWDGLPDITRKVMFDYQRDGIEEIVYRRNGRCQLTSKPGRGKSLMVSVILRHYGGDILILSPKSVTTPWQEQLEKWAGIHGTIVEGWKAPVSKVTIMTYASARENQNVLNHRWNCVIYDESHEMKDINSLQCRMLLPLGMKAKGCMIMVSATPRKKCNSELYTQLLPVVGGRILGTYHEFTARYCSARYEVKFRGRRIWTLGQNRYFGELNAIMNKSQYRAGDNHHLPDFRRHWVEVTVENTTDIDAYQKLMDAEPDKEKQRLMISELARKTAYAKVPNSIAFIKELMANHPTRKIAVFADSKKTFAAIAEGLGVPCSMINGDTNRQQRRIIIDQLSDPTDFSITVGLLSFRTCALGITLCPGVDIAVFVQLDWSIDVMEQCEGKVHRTGAVNVTDSYWLVGTNTCDMKIIQTLKRKTNTNSLVVDGETRELVFHNL